MCTNIATLAPFDLSAVLEAKTFTNKETTLQELKARVKAAITYLQKNIDKEMFNAADDLPVHDPDGNEIYKTGRKYVDEIVFKTFFAYLSKAYCILVMQGVPVTPGDYVWTS